MSSSSEKYDFLKGMLADKLRKFLDNALLLWPDNAALKRARSNFESDVAPVRNDPQLLSIPMNFIVEQFNTYFSMNEAQSEAFAHADRAVRVARDSGTKLSAKELDAVRDEARAAHTPSAAALRDQRSFFARVAAKDETVVTSIHHPLVVDSKLGESFAALRKNPAHARNADAIFAYFKQMVDAARLACEAVYHTQHRPVPNPSDAPHAPTVPAAPRASATQALTADQKKAMKLSVVPLAFTMEKFLRNAMLLWPDNAPLRDAFEHFESSVLSVISDEELVCLPMKFVVDQFNHFFSMNEAQSEAFAAGERAVQDALTANKALSAAEQGAVRAHAVRAHKPSDAALRDTRTFFARVAENDTRVVTCIHHPLIADSKLGERFAAMRKNPAHARNADAIFAYFKNMVNTANLACVGLRLPSSVVSSSLATTPTPSSAGGGSGSGSGKKGKQRRDHEAQHTARQVAGIVEALSDDAIAATKKAVEGKSKKEIQQMHQSSVDVQKNINSAIRLAEMKKRREARNKALGLS